MLTAIPTTEHNMAILAASKTDPNVTLSHRQRSNVISTLHPLVTSAVQFQQLIGSAAFHLLIRTYFAASIVVATSLWAGKSIVWRMAVVSGVLATRALSSTKQLVWAAWDCKRSRRFRKRLEFEVFILLLGPGGNAVLLMLFWPGWLLLACLGLGIWKFAG